MNEQYVDDLLPDGALFLSSMRIVEFVDAEGRHDMAFKADGIEKLPTSIGLLELAKSILIAEVRQDNA